MNSSALHTFLSKMPQHNFTQYTCLTLSWHTLIIFRIYVIEIKLDFVSFDDKNLQRRGKFWQLRNTQNYDSLE